MSKRGQNEKSRKAALRKAEAVTAEDLVNAAQQAATDPLTSEAPTAPAAPKPSRAKKPQTQVAALCLNEARDRVLLITSRGTGRWIIPKGWPMRKRSLPGTALQEAWEEAGVEGIAGQAELGRYHYDKLQDQGFAIPVEVRVFSVIVSRLKARYPEAGQRTRQWFRLDEAAPLVAEESLRALILSLPELIASGTLPKKSGRRRK